MYSRIRAFELQGLAPSAGIAFAVYRRHNPDCAAQVRQALGEANPGVNLAPASVGDREQHEEMTAFMVRPGIRPVVDGVYDLDRLADACRHLESGRFFGKVGVNLL